LIKGRKKTGEGRTIGQTIAAKAGHKDFGKWCEPLVKGFQGGFATEGITDEHHDKIDGVIGPKARAGKPDVFLDGFEETQMTQDLSEGSHFSQPGWK
jgi:hypothetical protein